MSRKKSERELLDHKDDAIKKIENFLLKLISSENSNERSKADLICYWLKDYMVYLDYETKFKPQKNKRYDRGEVINVSLGFNIGNEEGGRHYAVVLDVNNSINNGVITIVPLTSVKDTSDVSALPRGSIFLGNELFVAISAKYHALFKCAKSEMNVIKELMETKSEPTNMVTKPMVEDELIRSCIEKLDKIGKDIILLGKMKKEIDKMKQGSIALVSQITTISKIRIIDPKTTNDALSGIKMSNEALDKIDKCLKEHYTLNK